MLIKNYLEAQVRSVRNKMIMVGVGDIVITVDDKNISELKTAEEVEFLLRTATHLVLRRNVANFRSSPQSISAEIVSSPSNNTICVCF